MLTFVVLIANAAEAASRTCDHVECVCGKFVTLWRAIVLFLLIVVLNVLNVWISLPAMKDVPTGFMFFAVLLGIHIVAAWRILTARITAGASATAGEGHSILSAVRIPTKILAYRGVSNESEGSFGASHMIRVHRRNRRSRLVRLQCTFQRSLSLRDLLQEITNAAHVTE